MELKSRLPNSSFGPCSLKAASNFIRSCPEAGPTFLKCFPFRFPLNGFDERFRRSDLPVAEIEKIKRLTYTTRVLQTDYVQIDRSPSFGDVIALCSSTGEIFHTS